MVGGHDLLEELRSHKGRYCLLEVEYSTDPPRGEQQGSTVQS